MVSDLSTFFYKSEIMLLGCMVVGVWFLKPKRPKSSFKVRESDLKHPSQSFHSGVKRDPDLLAQAKIQRKEFLALGGIQIKGEPHEILGISAQASHSQIQQAYRDLMKQYHPDRVGRPGSREWNDAQKIAEAIIRAKEEMLKRIQK